MDSNNLHVGAHKPAPNTPLKFIIEENNMKPSINI